VVVVFAAITIPSYYKYGYEKMRYFRIALIIGTVVFFREIDKQILQTNTILSRGVLEVTRLSESGLMHVAIIGVLLAVFFLSFVCSTRIISKKEH